MRILAVDTALGACSVAVTADGKPLARHWVEMARGHAEALAPMVDRSMCESGLTFANLDRLAVTTGPGTFTGQRVGLAFMRGLRLALNRPLVGVTTLETMAAAAQGESGADLVAVLHEAKRGEVYVVVQKGSVPVLPVQVLGLAKVLPAIERVAKAHSGPLAVAGTAAGVAADWLAERGTSVLRTGVRQPDALWVARLAADLAAPSAAPMALYLRVPDARLADSAIRLRVAGEGDTKALAGLQGACLPEPWGVEFFDQLCATPGGFALMAEAGGVPLGFIAGRVAADEAEILSVGVLHAYRRNGVGRRLLQEAADYAARLGATALFLEVAEDNEPARGLYESEGFRVVGRRKLYYAGGGDALLLRSVLPLPGLGNRPELA